MSDLEACKAVCESLQREIDALQAERNQFVRERNRLISERDAHKRVAETSADIMENRNQMRRALSGLVDLFNPTGNWRLEYGDRGLNEALEARLQKAQGVLEE